MTDLIEINGVEINVVSENDTFMVSNKQVANGFGATLKSIQNMKSRNKKELKEGTHFVDVPNGNKTPITMWTKKGIITLGFKLRATKKTIAFRDWASDYIIKTDQQNELPMIAMKNVIKSLELTAQGLKHQDERLDTHNDRINDVETYIQEDLKSRPVSFVQQRALQDVKNAKVYQLSPTDEKIQKKLHMKVWSVFKKNFHLPRYSELPSSKFDEAIWFLNNLEMNDML